MNERIRLLAEQATTRVDAVSNESMAYTYFDTEKFAELIVRECMACSTWVGKVNDKVKEPSPIHTAHAINQRIKKQFGVEDD